LVASLCAAFLLLAWTVLAGGGWTVFEALILACLVPAAPSLALSAATALIGFVLRITRATADGAPLSAATAPARTVIALCIRFEDMALVLPPAETLLAALRAGPDGACFTLAILSDTPEGEAARREEEAVAALARRWPASALRYRRRARNLGFKAGNLMDFLDSDAAAPFEFVLVLDADSLMSAATVRRLLLRMQTDPGLAILQPIIAGHGAETPFARLFGAGHRHGTQIWATGQAWWQGPHGPYWGHNALIRIAPFRAHARLPALPNGRPILSHDHVEAALLHEAGWGVRVLPDDAGSAERHPPDLPALFARDLRWAAGNLQYRHLLGHRALSRIGRLQMLQAMLHYAQAPIWLCVLLLAALNVVTGGAEGTSRSALLALVGCGMLALHLPMLAGHAEARWRRLPGAPGGTHSLGRQGLFSLLLDPIALVDRSLTLLRLAVGRHSTWAAQRRDARGLSWSEGVARFGGHAMAGVLLSIAFASGGLLPLLLAAPALAGLLLVVPFAVLTSRPDVPASHGTVSARQSQAPLPG
jgi:membrane glycosyltransferase